MEELQIPKLKNWWLGDGSYHLRPPIESRDIRYSTAPEHLDENQPFVEFPAPEPLYVSKDLMRELRGVVKTEQEFEKLFAEKEETSPEEPAEIEADIEATAGDVHYDPNKSFSCAETDESFEITTETRAPALLGEIDAHLEYLRGRLGRLGKFSAQSIGEQREALERVQKKRITYRNAPKAAVFSRTQTIDPVAFLNERCIAAIEARDAISTLVGTTVERECGGSSTSYLKRNVGPFRPQGKLKGRSIPLFQEEGEGFSIRSYGQAGNPAIQPFEYVKNAHPQDEHLECANRLTFPEEYPPHEMVSPNHGQIYEMRQKAQRPQSARFVTYKSMEDERREITELKLHSKDENDVLEATAEILAQLRTDEQHLVTLLQDCQAEATRPPTEGWYERKDAGFSAEYKQAGLRGEMEQFLREIGGAPPSPSCDTGCDAIADE